MTWLNVLEYSLLWIFKLTIFKQINPDFKKNDGLSLNSVYGSISTLTEHEGSSKFHIFLILMFLCKNVHISHQDSFRT